MRVLVAEDDSASARLIGIILKRLGLEVTVCANGRDVLETLGGSDFDLLILDMNLPLVDGLAVAREIRIRESDSRRMPIIAVTGNAFPEDRERCLAAGMDDHLTKPLSVDILVDRVRTWIGLP
jgi:two-component system sensor histidine kinase/response regulator